jgi:hypothetical protein
MRWSDIMPSPSSRMLRQFAGLWLLFFGTLAVWQGPVLGNTARAVIYSLLAGSIGLLGLLFPRAIRPVYRASFALTFPIGWFVSHLILSAVFFGIFTPIALIFRIIRRDALALKLSTEKESYWLPKASSDAGRYFSQY